MKIRLLASFVLFWGFAYTSFGQAKGEIYTLAKLSQEAVNVTRTAEAAYSKEVGDTTFTYYSGCSYEVKTYFVNGAQYDNIFNPNPTGIYINKKHFLFFCGIEMSIRQNFSNVLQMSEFEYLGNKYLMIINFREDCEGEDCRYRCYNVFDITDPGSIKPMAFSSYFEGTDSFGDFNMDGILDFVRIAPKPAKDARADEPILNYLITSYAFNNGKAQQLTKDGGRSYYLYVKGDEEVSQFQILQADWFFTVKDTSGQVATTSSMYAEYISFDPLYRHMYKPDGVKIEKNRWSVFVTDLSDLEAAQEFCQMIQSNNLEDVYIMVDQYSGDIKYQIYVGNFVSKDRAVEYQKRLNQIGFIDTRLADLRNDY